MSRSRKPSFESFIKQGRYAVGCTGQSVVLYKDDEEIARFKDLIYAYHAVFSPNGDIFVVKTTDGRLGVYALDPPRLLKKFRCAKTDYAQDQGYAFSPDGKQFFNIEYVARGVTSRLALYDTRDFSLVGYFLDDDDRLCIDEIEADEEKGDYILLGFFRKPNGNEWLLMRFSGRSVTEVKVISEEKYNEIRRNKEAHRCGVPELKENDPCI